MGEKLLEILEKVEGNQIVEEDEIEEIAKMRETLRRKKKEYQEMCQRNFDVNKFLQFLSLNHLYSKL